jgi:hypothetical protein
MLLASMMKARILEPGPVSRRFMFKWEYRGAGTNNIGLGLYYLCCTVATAKLNEALTHRLGTESFNKLIVESFRYFVVAEKLGSDIEPVLNAPIMQHGFKYVYPVYFDQIQLLRTPSAASAAGNHERINACARIRTCLRAVQATLPSGPWTKWRNETEASVCAQAAVAKAYDLRRETDPKRELEPAIYAQASTEIEQLLEYGGVDDNRALYDDARTGLQYHYHLNVGRYEPTLVRAIQTGTFFDALRPPDQPLEKALRARKDSITSVVPRFQTYKMC